MTSSPGLRGWSCLQAVRGVLQTPTDDRRRRRTTKDARKQNNTGAPTLCVCGPVTLIQYVINLSYMKVIISPVCNVCTACATVQVAIRLNTPVRVETVMQFSVVVVNAWSHCWLADKETFRPTLCTLHAIIGPHTLYRRQLDWDAM